MTLISFSHVQATARKKPLDRAKIVAALDIGSTKVCCLIGETLSARRQDAFEKRSPNRFKVLGMGHQASRGTRAGTIINPEDAEEAIRLAVDQAERMAGMTISEVFVNVSGGNPSCTTHKIEIPIGGGLVKAAHIQEAIARAVSTHTRKDRLVLHAIAVRFDLDATQGVENPEGLYAQNMAVDVNIVTVDRAPMRNLSLVIERCHLSVAGFVIAPYAAAQTNLVEDEFHLGAVLIDLGGGTTNISVFHMGSLLFSDTLKIGSHYITRDLAQGLSTTITQAERLKTLSGSVFSTIWDDREFVSLSLLGEGGNNTPTKVPKSSLTKIIRPRVEEIFELIKERLSTCPPAVLSGKRFVLTGGGSQLTGIRDVAASILGHNVRIASPLPFDEMPEISRNQTFAVAAGLLHCALDKDRYVVKPGDFQISSAKIGRLKRIGQWIKESF